ncbi:hypothetical protein SAMN05443572_104626 [Myxococcus fulvus]|uniref:Uncharacterized protein n=1 Tax=Myxococcus fulvus TaxID=33 RepID=A0A511SZK1_MYXFU|nr:hypothetical protein [Myxococcus fulvus]GEN06743.1 hypothetical protein MFU01_17800 [Myxococcus fulvus]SEU05605.1 hypothetical protein SAMN05443572_104626 [Myxococcus fulvus]
MSPATKTEGARAEDLEQRAAPSDEVEAPSNELVAVQAPLGDAPTAAAPEGPSRSVAAVARSSLWPVLSVTFSLLGSGLWGALKGLFIFGCVGLALALAFVLAPLWLGSTRGPPWLDLLCLVLTPLSLALAGGYAMMLHGGASRLGEEAEKRGWLGYLYAVIKPAAQQLAGRLRSKGPLSRKELLRAVKQSVAERAGGPSSPSTVASRLGGLERFLMEQSYRVLGAIAVRAVVASPDGATAVRELESLAIERLQVALVERLEDLFLVQQILALGVGLLVGAIPLFILLLLS